MNASVNAMPPRSSHVALRRFQAEHIRDAESAQHDAEPRQQRIGERDAIGSDDDRHLRVQRYPERMFEPVARRTGRPDVVEQVVAEHDRKADDQACARA
jgi:hypothetical protein